MRALRSYGDFHTRGFAYRSTWVLRTHELEIWVGKQFLKITAGVCGFFGEIVEFAGEKTWPGIESLSIKQV